MINSYATQTKTRFQRSDKILISAYIFLGVIGRLIPIFPAIDSFRAYYILLPFGCLYIVVRGVRKSTLLSVLIISPIIIYSTFSVIYSKYPIFVMSAENPAFKNMLLVFEMLFMVLLLDIGRYKTDAEKQSYVFKYIKAYFVTVVVGFIFYIGFYSGTISLAFISNFQVQIQMAYGLFRFSPGDYPNAYGNNSSFVLSVVFLIIYYKKDMKAHYPRANTKKFWIDIYIMFVATFAALLLTTTRAAYISFAVSILYILFLSKGIKIRIRSLAKGITFIILMIILVPILFPSIRVVLNAAIGSIGSFVNGDVVEARSIAWSESLASIDEWRFWGSAVGSGADLHNIYLQLFQDYGIVGISIIIMCILLFIRNEKALNSKLSRISNINIAFINNRIGNLALLHILMFGLTNHNLNHHLTWFGLFFFIITRASTNGSSGQGEC